MTRALLVVLSIEALPRQQWVLYLSSHVTEAYVR